MLLPDSIHGLWGIFLFMEAIVSGYFWKKLAFKKIMMLQKEAIILEAAKQIFTQIFRILFQAHYNMGYVSSRFFTTCAY